MVSLRPGRRGARPRHVSRPPSHSRDLSRVVFASARRARLFEKGNESMLEPLYGAPIVLRTIGRMLVVENLSKAYGTRAILDRISFSVAPGEYVAIVGESGAGKSTLL